MASIISAGTSSGTALNLTGDTSGVLELKTNNGSTTALNLSTGGNVNIPTTGARITGDFSNGTLANRVSFQTSTTNSATSVQAIPNGTSATATFVVSNAADIDNSSIFQFQQTSLDSRLNANKLGTGSYLPLTMYTGGSERMRIDSSGNVGIGTDAPAYKLQVRRAGGVASLGINLDNTVGFTRDVQYYSVADSTSDTTGHAFYVRNGSATDNLALRISNTGTITLQGANTSATGVGIAFPASQSASSDANCLDDYEEGTWTPTVGATISDPTGVSYLQQQGRYTKIGNVVYVSFRVQFSFSSGTGSGSFILRGLPFTAGSFVQPKTVPQQDAITFTGYDYLDCSAGQSTATVSFAKNRTANTAAGVVIGDCNAGTTDVSSGFYYFV